MALGAVSSEQVSTAKTLSDLKAKLAKEKATRNTSRIEVKTLAQALEGIKNIADKFVVQIPSLEERIKYLDEKVMVGLKEIRAKELDLEHTTAEKNDYKKNVKLAKKLESKPPQSFCSSYFIMSSALSDSSPGNLQRLRMNSSL
jgi:predicted  nucleic acid-binding Zn-ribbon protein